MSTPPKRRADRRPTLTLKGDQFGAEFRALLNKAAKKKGQTQAEFVAEVLDREARRILSGAPDTPPDTPAAPPPAVVEHMKETDAKLEATNKQVADLADQVRKLTELHEVRRRSLWQKLRGAR